jgi:hypothetical protein
MESAKGGVGEVVVPPLREQLARHERGSRAVAILEHVQEGLAVLLVQRGDPEVVQDEDVRPHESREDLGVGSVDAGQGEFVVEARGPAVEDAVALAAGLKRQGAREKCLPCAGGAGDQDVELVLDEGTGGELQQRGLLQTTRGSGVDDLGIARTLLYDNLRSAVLARRGDAVQLHPRLLELSAHYHFQPRFCAVGRGNEKGRVERAIQYVRHSFFAARPFTSLEDFNRKALAWRDEVAHQRPWPGGDHITVGQAWEEERPDSCRFPKTPPIRTRS